MQLRRILLLTVLSGNAYSTTLTFDGLGISSSTVLPQDYGDRTGSTPNVEVSYRELAGFGDAAEVQPDLQYWEFGYGGLVDVAWGSLNIPSRVAEISFTADAGVEVVLHRFDLAGWAGNRDGRSVNIYDGAYTLLASWGPMTILGTAGAYSSFDAVVQASTIHLQWDYPWGVAIDNVVFEQNQVGPPPPAVPTSGVTLFLVLGAGAPLWIVGWRLRRRLRCSSQNSAAHPRPV